MKALKTVLAAIAGSLLAAPAAIGQEAPAAQAGTIAPGQTITGEISANDSQRRSGKYEDVFLLQGRRGQRIVGSSPTISIPIWS